MSLDTLPFGVAHHMALLPLATLAIRRERQLDLWLLAGVFGVSWLADTAAHWVHPGLVSIVYPVGQAGLVLGLLQPRRTALLGVVGLTALGIMAVLWEHGQFPDLLLRASCWGAIVASVGVQRPVSLLRASLLIYFGLGLIAWAAYVAAPGWTSWGVYQIIRFAGLALFSAAVWRVHEQA